MAHSHSPNFVATLAWQTKVIKQAVKKANTKKAKFVEHQKVVAWLNSWSSEKEQDLPRW